MAERRAVIPASCVTHRGAAGFVNLVVRRVGGDIELDPHVTGGCVVVLAEDAATALRDFLVESLG